MQGTDCTIISFGRPLHFCQEAAEELAKEGIDCEIIDGRTIRPLDIDTMVDSVRKTNTCVVVDQSWSFASVGSEIASQIHAICFEDLIILCIECTVMMSPPHMLIILNKRICQTQEKFVKQFVLRHTMRRDRKHKIYAY